MKKQKVLGLKPKEKKWKEEHFGMLTPSCFVKLENCPRGKHEI